MKVVVIGGGIAGLATAALLAHDGHDVELLEQRSELGGRVGSETHDGFRFDTGPSWWLMPEVFDHFFRLLGTSTSEQVDLELLDPGYRVFFEGHAEPVDVRPDAEANAAIFEALEPGAGTRLSAYLASARDAYEIAVQRFLYNDFSSPVPLLHPEVLRRLPRLGQLLARSLASFVDARFADRRLRQILGYPAVFLGSSPGRAPSMYHLMSWLDLADGVRYPHGGFGRLVEAVALLAEKDGARLRTGCTVTAIQTAPGGRRTRVTGVRYTDAAGEHVVEADLVVAAADLHHVETHLLAPELRSHSERWWRRRDPGPGVVLALLGVRGRLPGLSHHNLLFTADWDANFDAIFGSDRHVPDPASIYVCKPSEIDVTAAPPDHDNLFVLVPVPADPGLGRGGLDRTGSAAVEAAVDAAVAQIASWAGIPDLAERIVVRRSFGPGDFADDYNAWCGGALGPAHTLAQSAMFRAGNRSRKVDGLLYAGASVRPGIGLPMCLISAELVLKHLRGDRSPGPSAVVESGG